MMSIQGFGRALAMVAVALMVVMTVVDVAEARRAGGGFGSRGTRTFYQVRIGADTRPEADDLCNRIRRAGGACFVLRNRG